MFTIHAERLGTDRASVSQAVASRGAPPLSSMSLGASRCSPKKARFARRVECLWKGEGRWAWTQRNLVCGSEIPGRAPGPGRPGSRHRSEVEVGDGRPAAGSNRPVRKYNVTRHRPVESFRRGRPTPRTLPGSTCDGEAWSEGRADAALSFSWVYGLRRGPRLSSVECPQSSHHGSREMWRLDTPRAHC